MSEKSVCGCSDPNCRGITSAEPAHMGMITQEKVSTMAEETLDRISEAWENELRRAIARAEEQGYRFGYDAARAAAREEIENLEKQNAVLRDQNRRQEAALDDLHHTLARVLDYPR